MADEQEQIPYKITIFEDGQPVDLDTSKGINGDVTVAYPSGDKYEGPFFNGRRDTRVVEEQIKEGEVPKKKQKAKKGQYTFANGDVYEGGWRENLKHGIGKFSFKLGGSYHGEFVKGLRHGQGLFHYPNKDRYSGEWKYGKKHGKGTYIIDGSGIKLVGNWFEGQITEGKWILPNGDTYEGKFKHNKPIGNAKWTLANGNKLRGVYDQQILDVDEHGHDDSPLDPETGLRVSIAWKTIAITA
jgi:hypothetical protein